MDAASVIDYLKTEGYTNLCIIPERGICGLYRFVFTTGLVYGMTATSYEGRYCFEYSGDAIDALKSWDGVGDPPGDWIKHKGATEYSNPNKTTV